MGDPWDDEEDDGLEYLRKLDAFIERGEGGFALRAELEKLGAPSASSSATPTTSPTGRSTPISSRTARGSR